MSRAAYCALFGFEGAVVDNLFIVLQARSWASAEIFQGGSIEISLILYRLQTM